MAVGRITALVAGCLVLAGCQPTTEKQPTIAHTHIGHALTAWVTTPGDQGLYIVAEKEARALNRVVDGVNENSSLAEMKKAAGEALLVIDPPASGQGPGEGYGLRKAFDEAVSHLEFAGESADASANFRNSLPLVREKARAISERIELVRLLAQDVQRAQSAQNAAPLMKEIQNVSRSIIVGAELDGKPPVGSRPDEAGLNQLRDEIAAMTARENPPYVPVAEKWLFGLIRLPSGQWAFDFSRGGAGGGGGGGY